MNFSAWSIRHPIPAILLFALLTLLGLYSFGQLPVQDFPDMDLPTIQITASLEGAAPSQLETEVARKIENQLTSLNQLEHIATTITDGHVAISVTFSIDKPSEEALNEVRNAVDAAVPDLPATMDPPTVSKNTAASGGPFLRYAIDSKTLHEDELSWFVDNELTNNLLQVKGVAAVTRVGGIVREVHVDLDPGMLAGLGLTVRDIAVPLKSVQQDASGGEGDIGHARQAFRTLAAAHNVEEIAALPIPISDERWLHLDEIARVVDSHAERGTRAYVDGKEVIAFQVSRQQGFSDVSMRDAVRQQVDRFATSHPQVQIREISNTVEPIVTSYHGSLQLLLEGALLAVVVVFFFLGDWRATVISATALPLSILPAFVVMNYLGFSLNGISMLALALVVGILVDDAIVEVENMARHMRMGKSPFQAALDAADEIGLAVIATSLTLVAVFLPTAFMGGIPGLIFRQFGVTAAVAVLASLVVARLLTPMMAAFFMQVLPHQNRESRWMGYYLAGVRLCLAHRGKTLFAALLFFLLSLGALPWLSAMFIPPADDGQTQVTLTLAPGSTLDDTVRVSRQAESILRQLPDITHVFTSAGSLRSVQGPDVTSSHASTAATLMVEMKPRGEREKQSVIEANIREALRALAGVRVQVGSGDNGEVLAITLASDEAATLEMAARHLEQEMRTITGVGAVTSSAALQRPEIQITPDLARAAQLGVTTEALADTIRLATYGDYAADLGKLNLSQRQIPVRVRLEPGVRADLEQIGQLRVAGRDGLVALSDIADIRMSSGIVQIDRLDRSRNVILSLELNGRPMGEVMDEVAALPALQYLPQGVHLVEQGEFQMMADTFSSFGVAMVIGILCIYGVLVLLFHDFLQPVTILTALPLAICGALLALVVSGSSFSLAAVIGILMLMGIVTKNSILLVEYAIVARRVHGTSRLDALIDACHKRSRPIVMTTIAMGAGMLPIALGLGADPSFRQPMAIVVIGGLLTSTVLSLVVIPVVFTYIDDLRKLFRRKSPQARPEKPTDVSGASVMNWKRLLPLFVIVLIDAISSGVILPLLPFYSTAMGASPFVVGLLMASFSICQFVAAPWLGKLSDRYGRKTVLLGSQAGTFGGLVTLALAPSLPWVFMARILDGITSGNMSVAAAYAVDLSSPATRKRTLGVLSAAMGTGLMIGPALSGLLSHVSVAAPIWAAAAISLLSILATAILLPRTAPVPRSSQEPAAIGGHRGGLVQPGVVTILGLLGVFHLAFSMYVSQFALFLADRFTWHGLPLGPREVGIAFSCAGAMNVWVQLKGMRWAERWFTDHQLIYVGFCLAGIGYGSLAWVSGLPMLALAMLLASLGTSLLRPTLMTVLSTTVAASRQGQVMGMNQSLMALGNVIGPPVAGLLIGQSIYGVWALLLSGLMLLGGLSAWLLMSFWFPRSTPQRDL